MTVTVESDALLRGSESELHSIVSNLVTNAVKYTPREGRIHVTMHPSAAEIEVIVRDTGVGIPPDVLPLTTT